MRPRRGESPTQAAERRANAKWPSRIIDPWSKRRKAYLDGKRRPRGATVTPESQARQRAMDAQLQRERQLELLNPKPIRLTREDVYRRPI